MTPSIPAPNAAGTHKRVFAIPFERACRVLPKVLASALAGELRERGDGDFVVSCGSDDVLVRLEREGAETCCVINIDSSTPSSPVALEVLRAKHAARAALMKWAAVFVMGVLTLVGVVCMVAFDPGALRALPIVPFLTFAVSSLVGWLAQLRGEALLTREAARVRAIAEARDALAIRALDALDEHVSAHGAGPGYRIAAYEVDEDDGQAKAERRSAR